MGCEEKIPVSVIVMTRNEERNIRKCLGALSCFDEVFVVDSLSTDRTREIAEGLGAEVVEFRWNGRYPKKKQWCLENLPFKNGWVLYVDADEAVYPELAAEVRDLMKKEPEYAGYFVECDYVFAGRVLKYGMRGCKLALFERRKGYFTDYDDLDAANMWEVEGHYQPQIDGKVGALRNRMLHDERHSLFDYFQKHNRYSDWEAVVRTNGALIKNGESNLRTRRFLKTVFHRLPFRGLAIFIYSYILRLGFLDGSAGFNFAMAKSLYYWQISLKIREIRRRGESA